MATIDSSDCCLVCADPLEWTGIGVCGHKEICSRCVARMRFVLKDTACVLCKQESPAVFFTRFMGDFTARIAPDDYPGLKARSQRGEFHYCQAVDGYFDDKNHFEEIKSLCGYTHPIVSDEPGGPKSFRSLGEMKKHLDAVHKVSFCDICLQSRKVFACEQLLYTREQLNRHNNEGDETGPMAESGFKGHPLCRFCKKRFYDSQDLWRHMESAHEHCFLCRRRDPGKYVYYRHYRELEEEHELKRHIASEHGDELKLSKAQRREALNVPIQLQYRDQGAEAAAAELVARMEAPGTIIGGDGGSMAAQRGGRGRGMHHSRSEGQNLAEAQASGVMQDLDSVTFNTTEFPSLGDGMAPVGTWAASAAGSSASSGAAPSALAPAAPGYGRPNFGAEDFPALPQMTRAQRKQLVQNNLRVRHAVVANRFAPPSVLHRGAAPSAPPPLPTGERAAARPPPSGVPGADDFPALSSSTATPPPPQPPVAFRPASAARPGIPPVMSAAAGELPPPPPASVAGTASAGPPPKLRDREAFPSLGKSGTAPAPFTSGPSSSSMASAAVAAARFAQLTSGAAAAAARPATAAAVPTPQAPPSSADFPELPAGSGKAKWGKSKAPRSKADRAAPLPAAAAAILGMPTSDDAAAAVGAPANEALAAKWAEAEARAEASRAAAAATAAAATAGPSKPALTSPSDFPTLGLAASAKHLGKPSMKSGGGQKAAAAGSQLSTAAAQGAVQGGVSDALKAANKELVEKVRRQLGDDSFASFKAASVDFQRGAMPAPAYHAQMVELGLLPLLADLAALCPDADRRAALMSSHASFLSSPAAADVPVGWMPPEAAAAAAAHGASEQCWPCGACTLSNAPGARSCEACGAQRPGGDGGGSVAEDDFPSLGVGSSNGGSGIGQHGSGGIGQQLSTGKKKKGKGTVLAIGLPGRGAGHAYVPQAAPPPQSVWGGGGGGSNVSAPSKALKQRVEAERAALAASRRPDTGWD